MSSTSPARAADVPAGRAAMVALLTAAGGVAAVAGPGTELTFAAMALFVLGMPHGAGDLMLVRWSERPAFATAYLLAAGAVLLAWRVSPSAALCGFLALSIAHFTAEARRGERLAAGLLPIAGPALLHAPTLVELFRSAGATSDVAITLTELLRLASLVGVAFLAWVLSRTDDRDVWSRLLPGGAAAVLLPPLTGVTVAFLLLHALPETIRRADQAGQDVRSYLRQVLPVMAGAAGVCAIAAAAMRGRSAPDVATLFGAIAALATLHMLVTPAWTRPRASRPRPRRGELRSEG